VLDVMRFSWRDHERIAMRAAAQHQLAAGPHKRTRRPRARVRREAVTEILDVPPQRLARLSPQLVEAMHDQLAPETIGARWASAEARLVAQRATAVIDGLMHADDVTGARLAADLLVAAVLLQEHLDTASPAPPGT
jgi:hypothetical protein